MIPPEPQNFGFKFPVSGTVPVPFSSMVQTGPALLHNLFTWHVRDMGFVARRGHSISLGPAHLGKSYRPG